MELKYFSFLHTFQLLLPFNRTAYGIEILFFFAYLSASFLLIAPLMELKFNSYLFYVSGSGSFNRTAYGIEI